MRRSLVVVIALAALAALAACKSKSSPPPAGSGSGSGSVVAGTTADAAVADAPPAPSKPAPISKQIRAEYRMYLAAGRKAAKAAKWTEAITALQSALAAIPGDDRALAELSFAAMSAGDAEQARKAGRQAVLAATDPKIKAAALYNLGRVEETAEPTKAIALYTESLALRPNQIVEKRLAELKGRVSFTPVPPPCATPAPLDAVCACLNKTTELDPAIQRCETTATGLPDFQYARYAISELNEDEIMLVGKSDAGWAVVAALGGVYNPGAFGISEEWELASAKDERFGTHSIAKLVGHKSRTDSDMGINEVESEDTTSLLVCVRDGAGGLPTCPVDVVTDYAYDRDRLLDETDAELGIETGEHTAGMPIHSATKVSVEIGADGVAKVRAVSGRPDAAMLGDKRLWR